MHHLTEEQFEDVLRNAGQVPEHVARCPSCRARLDEKHAIARRLRRAFSSLEAPRALADRIRTGMTASEGLGAQRPGRIIRLHVNRYLWSALAAAAAILILALPIIFIGTTSRANAAEVALSQIHYTNLDSLGQLVSDQNPDEMCKYLESQLGHRPVMLRADSGLNLCGRCVREFQGQPVASYVVQGRTAPISVVAVPRSPEALGLTPMEDDTSVLQGIWLGKHGCCNIASVRIGDYSYCAVGEVTQAELTIVLEALLE